MEEVRRIKDHNKLDVPIASLKAMINAPIIAMAAAVAAFDVDKQLKGAVSRYLRGTDVDNNDLSIPSDSMSEFGTDRHYLHYLDEVKSSSLSDERKSEYGAVLEPDNENVLDSSQVHKVDVNAIRRVLSTIGALRFDTIFVRNLIFIVNLYRTVRVKLHVILSIVKILLQDPRQLLRDSLTEFRGNRVDRPKIRLMDSEHPHHRRYERHDY